MCQTCPGIKVLEKALNVTFWMSPPPLWHQKNFSKILLDAMGFPNPLPWKVNVFG